MASPLPQLFVTLGLLLGTALPSPAAAAAVRLPISQETAVSPVLARGADPANARSYFGARYYRADIGRFTTVDPELNVNEALLDPQQWNRYAYVKNNPLKYTDPDGKFPVAVAAAIPGPQQVIVAAGLGIAGAVVIYKNREVIASEIRVAWNASSDLLGRGVQAVRDATDNIIYSKSDPGRGLRGQIAEHEKKLADYIADPDGHDNKGFLKNTTPEQRAKIIDARIRELQKQIEKRLRSCSHTSILRASVNSRSMTTTTGPSRLSSSTTQRSSRRSLAWSN